MKSERLSGWLPVFANLGVIVGIVFLIVELDQADRISRYAAENARRNQFMEINSSRIEYADVFAKIQANDTELTRPEKVQALMMVRQLMNTWFDAESAYNYGLLSEETFEGTLVDVSVSLTEAPGFMPFIAYLYFSYGHENDVSLVSNRVGEILKGANIERNSNEIYNPTAED